MLKSQDVLPLMLLLWDRPKGKLNQKNLAHRMGWGVSTLHRSLQRLADARLWNPNRNFVHQRSAFEFVRYGVRYSFPAEEVGLTRGIVTATLPTMRIAPTPYVWPYEKGQYSLQKRSSRIPIFDFKEKDVLIKVGVGIVPLDKGFIHLVIKEPQIANWLHLVEVFRVGRSRELNIGEEYFHKWLK